MGRKEKHPFYLYSIGYSPAQITLGTLIFRNYANPDHRCISFPRIDENELARQDLVSSTNFDACCWASTKSSIYGLGLQALDFASVNSAYAVSLEKVILAEKSRRVVLNDPVAFFQDRVLQNPQIRKMLAIWLTATKASYLLRKATFQKPKVYCVTGFYELSGVRARIRSSNSTSLDVCVEPGATGIPLGLQIGPFSDGKSLVATVSMQEPSIWAARFNQLDVEYLRSAIEGQTSLPETICLRADVTDPGGTLMAGTAAEDEGQSSKVLEGSDVRSATVARLHIHDGLEEMDEDYKDDDEYSLAFDVAERRIKADAEASDEDDE